MHRLPNRSIQELIIFGGDFNTIHLEKVLLQKRVLFPEFIEIQDYQEASFESKYTEIVSSSSSLEKIIKTVFVNKLFNIKAKLDKFYINSSALEKFIASSQIVESRVISDHKPVLCKVRKQKD